MAGLSVAPVANPTFLGVASPNNTPTISSVGVSNGGLQGEGGIPNNATTVSIPMPSSTNTAVHTNTNSTASTPATTTKATLSPALIQAALTSIANQKQTYQNKFKAVSATNAQADKQQMLDATGQEQNNSNQRNIAYQNAEQAAAQGDQGLRAVLASLGALGGTGEVLAGRAVANSANSDIGAANNTYTTNDQAIQKALKDYLTQKSARDAALKDALNTDNRNAQMTGYQNIINEAENIGDTATAAKYLPDLTSATAPAAAIVPQAALYNPASVGAYSPTSSLHVTAAPNQAPGTPSNALTQSYTTPVNSALYTTKTGPAPA